MRAEEAIQIALFDYLKAQYPKIVALSETSGLRCSMGMARKLKRIRSNHTHLDIYILEPRGKHSALIIELKAKNIYKKDGSLLKDEHLQDQQKTIDLLRVKGYKASFAVGFDEAKKMIDEYLNGNN